MSAPLYFLPKTTQAQLNPEGKLNRSLLASRGLGELFADVRSAPEDAALFELTGLGPGGASGCLMSALSPSKQPPLRLGYYPEWQTWTQFEGPGGAVWVGLDNEHPPMAEDLARPKQFDGYSIELLGQPWKIPIVRDPVGGTRLPRDWTVEPDGEVSERIKAAYRELWEEFISVVDLFFNPDDDSPAGVFKLDRAEAMRRCLQAIGLNYRVGRFEQNLLGLVDADNWSMILAAAVDMWTFWDLHRGAQEKKTARAAAAAEAAPPASVPESSGIASGPQAACPITGPAGAS